MCVCLHFGRVNAIACLIAYVWCLSGGRFLAWECVCVCVFDVSWGISGWLVLGVSMWGSIVQPSGPKQIHPHFPSRPQRAQLNPLTPLEICPDAYQTTAYTSTSRRTSCRSHFNPVQTLPTLASPYHTCFAVPAEPFKPF